MLVFAQMPSHSATYPRGRRCVPESAFYPEIDYFTAVAERAAHDYAAATVHLRAVEQQRQQLQRQRYFEEVSRRQAALDNYYLQQSQLAASVRPTQYTPARRAPCTYSIEELAYSVTKEEERRHALLAQQREAQRTRALAEAKQREEAERLQRARSQAQRARQEEALLALLGLPEVTSDIRSRIPEPLIHREVPIQPRVIPTRQATDEVNDGELQAAFENLLSQMFSPRATSSALPAPPKPADLKGKGKATDIPSEPAPIPAPVPTTQTSSQAPSFKEELEARIQNETDPEIQESLVTLYSDIFDVCERRDAQPVAGPSVPKHERQVSSSSASAAETTSQPAQSATPEATPKTTPTEGSHLHRTPALPAAVAEKLLKFYHARRARKLSLAQITAVEDALRKLESTFAFPSHLDFVNPLPTPTPTDSDEPGALAYTPNNTPVHAYEHALNGLLTQLDAVESNGDLAVRGRRKEVVREVERALEAVERRVEESREREREKSRERRRSAASSPAPSGLSSDMDDDNTTVRAEARPEPSTNQSMHATGANDTPLAEPVSVTPADVPSTEPASDGLHAATSPHTLTLVTEPEVSPVDAAPAAPSDSSAPVVSEALVDAVSPPSNSDATPAPFEVVDAPETDAVGVELVNLSASESLAEADPPTVQDEHPDTEAPQGSPDYDSTPDTLELVSPITPSEPSDVDTAFATAPSTLPSTTIPSPESITRETSTATDTTFLTALSEAEPTTTPHPELMTRAPSETSSAARETFLLSSTPLADEPKRRPEEAHEDDELEIIGKEEAAKSDSEWSDVDA
ncbi:hypothetical protein C8Q78DRAFT_704647 [Trametes maxima]|nr:hypothetical protein C8Q78DRAFT_704647 [Trametes maxima]